MLVLLLLLLLSAPGLAQEQPTAERTAVERGKYLATAANCISCHTRHDGAPYSGGVAFETPLGTVYSTNITPDPETGIGHWQLEDLRRAMRQGIAADYSPLFPVFPYTAYTRLSDADIADIHAYLHTLEPVRYTPPDNGLLLQIRWPMHIWNALYLDEGPKPPDASQTAQWNRGAYLVEALGHCSVCHSPRNVLLAEQRERAYQGGVMMAQVQEGKQRPWFAVNLTSAAHGLGSWSVDDLERYVRSGFSRRGASFGPMNEVVVNSLRHLEAADQRAMAVYLKSLPGPEYKGESVTPALVQAGAGIYEERCGKCHGDSGRGSFFKAPPLAGSAIVQGEDPSSLINSILYGTERAPELSYGAWETMPAYANKLDDAQIAALCNFLRGSWGHRASAVEIEDVQRQR